MDGLDPPMERQGMKAGGNSGLFYFATLTLASCCKFQRANLRRSFQKWQSKAMTNNVAHYRKGC